MEIDTFGKYRNFLLPLADCIAIIFGYYFISVLITDSFLMDPTSAITRNELIISIILAIIVFQVVFRITKDTPTLSDTKTIRTISSTSFFQSFQYFSCP